MIAPALAALLPTGCAPATLASQLAASTPSIPGQTTCGVVPNPSRPLVVEWSALDRASLEARAKQGLVAVNYVGCHIEVLPECAAPARFAYVYTPTTTKRDTVHIRNDDDLYTNLPLGAARLEGTLERAGELRVEMTIVGRYGMPPGDLPRNDLVGPDCTRATHVISGLTVGEFDLLAAGRASLSAGGGLVVGPSAGGQSSASKQQLAQDGDEHACGKATGNDAGPPAECAAPLRIELTPVAAFENECPAGFHVDSGACTADVVRQCDPGAHFVEGRGCVPDDAVPIATDCPQGFTLHAGWCMPPVSTDCPAGMHFVTGLGCTGEIRSAPSVAPAVWMASPAPVARLKGMGPEALQAEDLYASGDLAAASKMAIEACDAGDGFGCGLAGKMIARGEGCDADAKHGDELLRRGCSMGDPWSCTQMGQ